MPILRVLFVLLVLPYAFAGEVDDCNDRLIRRSEKGLVVSIRMLAGHPAFSYYDTFPASFRPWLPEGGRIVGRTEDGRVALRLNVYTGRLTYEQKNDRGARGTMNLSRNVAYAALSARSSGHDLADVHVTFAADGALTADVPATRAGTSFVVTLFNRGNYVRDLEPLELERYDLIDRLPRTRAEMEQYEQSARAIEREADRTWLDKLKQWTWLTKTSPASLPPPVENPDELAIEERAFLPLPSKVPAFTEATLAEVTEWLDVAVAGDLRVNPLKRTLRYRLPSARGMKDLVANARRAAEIAILLAREGFATDGLSLEVDPATNALAIALPYDEFGLRFADAFEQRRSSNYADAAVIVPDLSVAELESVRLLLRGLEPTILYAKGATDYFVRAPDTILPTATELEAVHQAKGGALPQKLRHSYPTLRRSEAAFQSLGDWSQNGDDWTARGFGVTATIETSDGRVRFAFDDDGTAPGENRRRVERIVTSLNETRGSVDVSGLKLELGRGARPTLVLTTPIDRLATRVLTEIRIPTALDTRVFSDASRLRAGAWFQEQYDDARAAFPVQSAAE